MLVDFAHTPAGLEVVLGEARRLTGPGGRVLVVFGCGGDRDRAKRPLMGAAAGRGSDLAVLTSDNPRHEDPWPSSTRCSAGVLPSAEAAWPPGAWSSSRTGGRPSPGPSRLPAPATCWWWPARGTSRPRRSADRRLPFDDRAVVTEALSARWPGDPAGWVGEPVGRG